MDFLAVEMIGGQRVRGVSFKQEYQTSEAPATVFQKMKARLQPRQRQPSMVHDASKVLIPPKNPQFADRITVVLDLDETLIYAREGPLYVRPGMDHLMELLKKSFEAVVWTAGVKAYAQAVVRNIDKLGAVQHCVYRHQKWFTGEAGYNKDLNLLGRELNTTLIIENTPDCLRGNEKNGILVSDYAGGELADNTLLAIVVLLEDLLERVEQENLTIPDYIMSSRFLTKREIPTDVGDTMVCYCLEANDRTLFRQQHRERVNPDLLVL